MQILQKTSNTMKRKVKISLTVTLTDNFSNHWIVNLSLPLHRSCLPDSAVVNGSSIQVHMTQIFHIEVQRSISLLPISVVACLHHLHCELLTSACVGAQSAPALRVHVLRPHRFGSLLTWPALYCIKEQARKGKAPLSFCTRLLREREGRNNRPSVTTNCR